MRSRKVVGVTSTSSSLTRLGQALRHFRESTGLTQEEFAARVGRHRTYISQIERGLANPSFMVLDGILRACRVGWTDLAEQLEARPTTQGLSEP